LGAGSRPGNKRGLCAKGDWFASLPVVPLAFVVKAAASHRHGDAEGPCRGTGSVVTRPGRAGAILRRSLPQAMAATRVSATFATAWDRAIDCLGLFEKGAYLIGGGRGSRPRPIDQRRTSSGHGGRAHHQQRL